MLRKLGADALYDYKDADYVARLAQDPKHKGLKIGLDAIGKDTADQCFAAFEACGTAADQGRVATVRPKDLQKESIKAMPDAQLTSADPGALHDRACIISESASQLCPLDLITRCPLPGQLLPRERGVCSCSLASCADSWGQLRHE